MWIWFLAGCAAMVRSWSFAAPPVTATGLGGAEVEIAVLEATVSQRAARVWLVVRNTGDGQRQVRIGQVRMGTPWGQAIDGALDPRVPGLEGLLDADDASAALGPGGAMTVEVVFRQHGHDLRRHPGYEIRLTDLTIDGRSVDAPPIRVAAPEDAPMGEHI